jgi:hypothetical protein
MSLDKYENPITTKENINELHHILVQTCLDYMVKNGLKDIDEIHFDVDGLSGISYEQCQWTPTTDSSLLVIGLQTKQYERKDGKFKDIYVRKEIGFSM